MQALVVVTFICSITAVSALSAISPQIRPVEELRFNTRSPSGWILLLNIFALPLLALLLALRFLDIKFLNNHQKIFLSIVSLTF